MVPMSSLDAINIDDGFDVEKLAKQFKAFKNVFVDVSYVKNCIDTLTSEELEKVIKHCSMLIERNNIEMGGV